jgi:hypothetical protein
MAAPTGEVEVGTASPEHALAQGRQALAYVSALYRPHGERYTPGRAPGEGIVAKLDRSIVIGLTVGADASRRPSGSGQAVLPTT